MVLWTQIKQFVGNWAQIKDLFTNLWRWTKLWECVPKVSSITDTCVIKSLVARTNFFCVETVLGQQLISGWIFKKQNSWKTILLNFVYFDEFDQQLFWYRNINHYYWMEIKQSTVGFLLKPVCHLRMFKSFCGMLVANRVVQLRMRTIFRLFKSRFFSFLPFRSSRLRATDQCRWSKKILINPFLNIASGSKDYATTKLDLYKVKRN